MKKIFLALAVAIASMGAVEINAQSVSTEQNATSGVAVVQSDSYAGNRPDAKKGKKNKKDKKGKKGRKGNMDKKRGYTPGDNNCCAGKKGKGGPMAGIVLTPAQQTEFSKLNDERKDKVGKVREDSKKKIEKINIDYDKDLKKILTPEQYAQYEENKARRAEKKMDKGDRRRPHQGNAVARRHENGPKGKKGGAQPVIYQTAPGQVGPTVQGPRPKKDTTRK